ncbi:MAG: ABC transporter permease subunit [Chloroflexi bacterium]|nr:ABC transporter permease subunit [Chloroflexota bacterium]
MLNYILRRIVIAFFMLIGIGIVSFVVIKLPPGDFASRYEGFLLGRGATQEDAERAAQIVREQYGLDQPIAVQFFDWVKGMVTEGSFGYSLAYRTDVGVLIADRLPKTLIIAILAHLISTVIGVGLGIFVATRKYGFWDNFTAVLSFIFTSIPRFSLAIILLFVLVFQFKQPSITSFFSPQYVTAPWSWDRIVDMFRHIWPVLLIAGLGGVARNLRVMRANLLDVLGAQYVQTARSKGLKERIVILRHAVPNALHTIIAYQGTVLPYMMTGELEVAIILGLPTLGPLFYESLVNQDIYISGSLLLIYGALILIGNLLADIYLSVLDPRIRYS